VRVVGIWERCIGCGDRREVDTSPPWPVVDVPGFAPDRGVGRRGKMSFCHRCAGRITEPLYTVGDLQRQLGHRPWLRMSTKLRLGESEPLLGAIFRRHRAKKLRVVGLEKICHV